MFILLIHKSISAARKSQSPLITFRAMQSGKQKDRTITAIAAGKHRR